MSLRAESGHIAPGQPASLVDAVLDLPEVQDCAHLEAAFPLGDSESLHRLKQRCEDVSTHPGWGECARGSDPPIWPCPQHGTRLSPASTLSVMIAAVPGAATPQPSRQSPAQNRQAPPDRPGAIRLACHARSRALGALHAPEPPSICAAAGSGPIMEADRPDLGILYAREPGRRGSLVTSWGWTAGQVSPGSPRRTLERDGCRSFDMVLDSIWRMRSLVTP